MTRAGATALLLAMLAACADTPRGGCYAESGWLDSSQGCSERAGYPDCYLVCPQDQQRIRLGSPGR